MDHSKTEINKAIVLEAFDTLFNKRDYIAAERFWSPNYVQHSGKSTFYHEAQTFTEENSI